MQLLHILEGLTTAEINKLEKQLKEGKAETYLLFRELKRCLGGKREYDKEKAFSKVFGETYTSKRDYLHRNEVRNLKNILYRYIAFEEFNRVYKERPLFEREWLIRGLAFRSHNSATMAQLYADEMDKAMADDYSMEPGLYATLLDIMAKHNANYASTSMLTGEDRIGVMDEWLKYEQKSLLYAVRKIEFQKAYQMHILHKKGKSVKNMDEQIPFDPLHHIDLNTLEDNYTEYLGYRKDTYLLNGERRVEALQKALAKLRAIDPVPQFRPVDEITILNNLSVELSLLRRYEEAAKVSDEIVAMGIKEQLVPVPQPIVSAIQRTYLYAGRYRKGIDFFYEYLERIQSNPRYMRSVFSLAYSHLFLGETKEAIQAILQHQDQKDNAVQPNIDFEMRMMTILAYLVDKEYQDAKRELTNYKRSTAYKNNSNAWVPEVIQLMERFINIMIWLPEEQDADLYELKQLLTQREADLEPTTVIFLWLNTQVNEMLK